jgi:uncharacterized protein YbjT (DUF2867 family)
MQMSEVKTRPILVLGATGRQGGAVARHLAARGWSLRALVRDTNKPQSRELARRGIQLVAGDFDDPDSLRRAMNGVYGVFSVQQFWGVGPDAEVRQGTNVAEAAHLEGVSHFVYSSVGSANRDTGIPHFESKARIEERIKLLELPYTILRPVFFMENWEMIAGPTLRDGRIVQPLDADRSLQQLAVDDIGAFATLIFEHPDDWIAHELDIAGDELTLPQVAETFSRNLGRRIQYVQIPMEQFRRNVGPEMADMYQWFNDVGYQANISYLRRQHPGLKSLEQFLPEQQWVKQMVSPGAQAAPRR